MLSLALLLGTFIVSYLLGAIPFGWLMARWRGIDIRQHGSGNIGATNVGRVLGRRFGILVFLLDFAKGALPAAVATWVEWNTDWNRSTLLPSRSLKKSDTTMWSRWRARPA